MRYIVVFLILANLGYLGWSFYQPPAPSPDAGPSRNLLNNGLMLVNEYQEQREEIAAELAAAGPVCYVLTPVPSVDEARILLAEAQEAGFDARIQLTGEPLQPQYRVYLPPASTREIATVTLDGLSAQLTAANLEIETYLLTRGFLEDAIALWVYQQPDNAERVESSVEELGYEVEIEEIPRSTGAIELVLQVPESDPSDRAEWPDFTATRPYLTLTENNCETIAEASQFP